MLCLFVNKCQLLNTQTKITLFIFTRDKREKKQMDFDWNCLLGKF